MNGVDGENGENANGQTPVDEQQIQDTLRHADEIEAEQKGQDEWDIQDTLRHADEIDAEQKGQDEWDIQDTLRHADEIEAEQKGLDEWDIQDSLRHADEIEAEQKGLETMLQAEKGEQLSGALVALMLTIGVALSSTAALIFSTDPPNLQALGVKPAAAATATAPCSNGPGALAPSGVILACVGFQNTQLPNVFPEVPPAVATPTPTPVVTPTPESISTSTSSSQSTQRVTPPPPTPIPANCVPSTMTASDNTGTHTISGSGTSTDKTFHYTSAVSSASNISFTISGLIKCTNQQHHIMYASGSSGTFWCQPSMTSTITAPSGGQTLTTQPSEAWTIHVYDGPGC